MSDRINDFNFEMSAKKYLKDLHLISYCWKKILFSFFHMFEPCTEIEELKWRDSKDVDNFLRFRTSLIVTSVPQRILLQYNNIQIKTLMLLNRTEAFSIRIASHGRRI